MVLNSGLPVGQFDLLFYESKINRRLINSLSYLLHSGYWEVLFRR
jgi:hypothetical protein